jgi:TetR/AcrR family transcriptional repressor of nem operon
MSRNIGFDPEEKTERALRVFWEKGYSATSVQDLVEAMQINRSSLYNSFGDKHSLFLICLSAYCSFSMNAYQRSADYACSALQGLYAIIDMVVDVTVHGDKSCMGVKSAFELDGKDEHVNTILKKAQDDAIAMLEKLIRAGQANLDIDPSHEAGILAIYIFSSFTGWRQTYLVQKNADLLKEMASFLKRSISSHVS